MADPLKELHLVANVVRHGEGRSCAELKAGAQPIRHLGGIDGEKQIAAAPLTALDLLDDLILIGNPGHRERGVVDF